MCTGTVIFLLSTTSQKQEYVSHSQFRMLGKSWIIDCCCLRCTYTETSWEDKIEERTNNWGSIFTIGEIKAEITATKIKESMRKNQTIGHLWKPHFAAKPDSREKRPAMTPNNQSLIRANHWNSENPNMIIRLLTTQTMTRKMANIRIMYRIARWRRIRSASMTLSILYRSYLLRDSVWDEHLLLGSVHETALLEERGVDGGLRRRKYFGYRRCRNSFSLFSGTDRGVSTSFLYQLMVMFEIMEGILGGGVVASESSIVAMESRVFGNWISADDGTLGVQTEWSVVLAGLREVCPPYSLREWSQESQTWEDYRLS